MKAFNGRLENGPSDCTFFGEAGQKRRNNLFGIPHWIPAALQMHKAADESIRAKELPDRASKMGTF